MLLITEMLVLRIPRGSKETILYPSKNQFP